MKISVQIDAKALNRAANRTDKALSQPLALMTLLGRRFRDDVRNRMNSRDNGSWAPASKWTRAKKRTNRALAGQAKNVSFTASNNKTEVFYKGTNSKGKSINITEHHFGKTLPATGALVSIPIANPRPLSLPVGTTKFYFHWNKSSIVPRRKIWPDGPGEAQRIADPIVFRWVQDTVDKNWQ